MKIFMKKKNDKSAVQPKRVPDNPFLLPGHRLHRWSIKSPMSESLMIVGKVGQATILRDKPCKPFSDYELASLIAKQCREADRPVDNLTRKWIEVPTWTEDRECQEIHSFLRPNNDAMGPRRLGIRVHLNGSQAAAQALGSMARECLDQLQDVADSIRDDKFRSDHASIAAEELARVIGDACCKMNELARTHPRIFQRFSRELWKWPIMKSTCPEFGDDETALLNRLKIGKDLPLRLDRKALWARQIDDEAGRIAWHLLWYIRRVRSENNTCGANYGEFSKMADALARPNRKSAPKWWEVAKAILLYSYAKLEEVDEFKRLVTAKSKRRTSGRIRQAIFDKLKDRFISLVKDPRRAKTTPHLCDCGNAALRRSIDGWICERCYSMENTPR